MVTVMQTQLAGLHNDAVVSPPLSETEEALFLSQDPQC